MPLLWMQSPAVGAGINLSSIFTDDYAGRIRLGSWDIGAYAYPRTSYKGVTIQTGAGGYVK